MKQNILVLSGNESRLTLYRRARSLASENIYKYIYLFMLFFTFSKAQHQQIPLKLFENKHKKNNDMENFVFFRENITLWSFSKFYYVVIHLPTSLKIFN